MEKKFATRRDMLQVGLAALGGLACDGCRSFGARRPDTVIEPKDGLIDLGNRLSSLLLQSEKSVLVRAGEAGDKILVVHGSDGELHAINSVCTHKGCDVRYDNELGHLRCPCHGSEYGLDGHNIKGPAERPLKAYNVTTRSGRVIIEL